MIFKYWFFEFTLHKQILEAIFSKWFLTVRDNLPYKSSFEPARRDGFGELYRSCLSFIVFILSKKWFSKIGVIEQNSEIRFLKIIFSIKWKRRTINHFYKALWNRLDEPVRMSSYRASYLEPFRIYYKNSSCQSLFFVPKKWGF